MYICTYIYYAQPQKVRFKCSFFFGVQRDSSALWFAECIHEPKALDSKYNLLLQQLEGSATLRNAHSVSSKEQPRADLTGGQEHKCTIS